MKVLVVGGEGFIGKYLRRQMEEEGWAVFSSGRDSLDVTKPEDFDDFRGAGFDAVIHLAALLMIDGHKPEDYFRVNAYGTYNVLEFCRKEKIPAMVYTMTHSDTNMSENLWLKPYDPQLFTTGSWDNNSIPFISSKIAAADMIEAYTRSSPFFRGAILRLSNIRGFGSQDTKHNCVFHQFIEKAKRGEGIEIWGNPPKTRRDMIYVKDVCSAIIAAVKHEGARGFLNVGSGVGLTIEDEAKAILEVFGDGRSKLVYRPDIAEVRKVSCVFDIRKTKLVLGWLPQYSYADGLRDMKKESGM